MSLDYCEGRIRDKLSKTAWVYTGLVDAFIGGHSRVLIECGRHGYFESTFHYVNQGNFGCMSCAAGSFGFDQTKPAHLYMLKSKCGGYAKIGISGNIKRRMRHLKTVTPFDFRLLHKWASTGTDVLRREREFHSRFESAGLSGFEGYSEWLKCSPDLESEFLRLLG